MKRAPVHLIFATVALCCAAAAGYDWVRLQHAQQVNQAAAAAASAIPARPANQAATGAAARNQRVDDEAREVRLARAMALSKAGAYDTAGPLFEDLIHHEPLDAVGRAALFDLGNMYLREGIGHSPSGMVQSAAMVEEAKSRYRTLLRAAPDDWDARYNLERALWLAPETRAAPDSPQVKEQHNIKLRDPQSQDLP
jgi:mxaK protein